MNLRYHPPKVKVHVVTFSGYCQLLLLNDSTKPSLVEGGREGQIRSII